MVYLEDRAFTAHKPHKCDGCDKAISPGDRYQRTAVKWPGEDVVEVIRLHATCHAEALKEAAEYDTETNEGSEA